MQLFSPKASVWLHHALLLLLNEKEEQRITMVGLFIALL